MYVICSFGYVSIVMIELRSISIFMDMIEPRCDEVSSRT